MMPSMSRAERIFRASGVAPLGAFVLLHVLSYAEGVLLGREPSSSGTLSGLPGLVLEIGLVLLPLSFHTGYGLLLLFRSAEERARREPNALLLVQRWSSPVVLLYLIDHLSRFRWPMLTGLAEPADARALLLRELSATTGGVPAVAAFHCLGVAAVAFHLGYGLYAFEWAKVPALAPARRRLWLGVLTGLFVLFLGSCSIIELATGKTFPFV